jgi:hypothetical protein
VNCVFHADRVVEGMCNMCGRPICDECIVSLNGQIYCKSCLEARVQRPRRDINGGARFLLSLVPGLGHLYMGLFQRGLQFMVGTVGGAILLGMLFPAFIGLLIPAMIFYSIFDAREIHLQMAQGLEVADKGIVDIRTWRFDWNNRYIGYALVVVGVLALFNTFIDDALRLLVDMQFYQQAANAIRGMMMGALAIAAGFWLLRRNGAAR